MITKENHDAMLRCKDWMRPKEQEAFFMMYRLHESKNSWALIRLETIIIDHGTKNKCTTVWKNRRKNQNLNGFNSYLFAHTDDEFRKFSDWSPLHFVMMSFQKSVTMVYNKQHISIELYPLPLVITSHSSHSSLTWNTSLKQENYVHLDSNF